MKLQVARKTHKCKECGNDIPKGHKYWNFYESEWIAGYREHTNCELYVGNKYKGENQ